MNKDDLSASGKNEIGLSWQVFAMKPESEAEFVGSTPNDEFRGCVSRTDRRHIGAAAMC